MAVLLHALYHMEITATRYPFEVDYFKNRAVKFDMLGIVGKLMSSTINGCRSTSWEIIVDLLEDFQSCTL